MAKGGKKENEPIVAAGTLSLGVFLHAGQQVPRDFAADLTIKDQIVTIKRKGRRRFR